MSENTNPVAGAMEALGMPADDAQAAEISAEELFASISKAKGAAETAEQTGDGDQGAQETGEEGKQAEQAKGNQIRAALKSQRRQIFAELGMGEDQVRELIRAHKAEEMAKVDPEITPKAARKIIEAEEKAAAGKPSEAIVQGIRRLQEDGWSGDEIRAFVSDPEVVQMVNEGKTVGQAARAYLMGQRAARQETEAPEKTEKRKPVPVMKAASAATVPGKNRFDGMTSAQFREFYAKAKAAHLAGKDITF